MGAALLSLPFAGWACAGASDGVRQLVIPPLTASSATCTYRERYIRDRNNYNISNSKHNHNSVITVTQCSARDELCMRRASLVCLKQSEDAGRCIDCALTVAAH